MLYNSLAASWAKVVKADALFFRGCFAEKHIVPIDNPGSA